MTFDILFLKPSKFWNETKKIEKKVKQLTEKRGHSIVAVGGLGGNVSKRPLAGLSAWFVLKRQVYAFQHIAEAPQMK